ncbi:hypothetical protein JCM5350_005081, partial [Sporobolomyces pararoseus]
NLSFLPIVALALVFNLTNTVGYTYGESFILFPRKFVESPELTHSPCALRKRHIADRDAKRRWATGMAANGMLGSMGGFGGSIVTGLASTAYSKFFG